MGVKCLWNVNNSGNRITSTEFSHAATLPTINHTRTGLELNLWLHRVTPATKDLNYTMTQRILRKLLSCSERLWIPSGSGYKSMDFPFKFRFSYVRL
jgi:hypothetical protein